MKWSEAVSSVVKPTMTRRDAQGLVSFARAAFNVYAQLPNVSLTEFDWYPYALAALGFEKPGDKFKIDLKFQLQDAPRYLYDQLKAALITMASELDGSAVPFRLVVDPRGTDAGFRKLATDAWAAMKVLAKQGVKTKTLAHDVIDWPDVVASSPPAATKQKPKQEVTAQPVDKPLTVSPAPEKKKSSGAWLLFLLAIASTRKRKHR